MSRFYKPAMAGWKMTSDQARSFWRRWGVVCAAQGWDALPATERNAKRHEMLAGLGFASIKDVNKTTGFDALVKRLHELKSVVKNEAADAGARRRVLHRVEGLIHELEDAAFPAHRLAAIYAQFHLVEGWRSLGDLPVHGGPQDVSLVQLSVVLQGLLKGWLKRDLEAPRAAEMREEEPVLENEPF